MAGISHNITAMGAYRNYSANNNALSRSLEKLSSGYKINRAGDDAAGLAISEKMRAQISGLGVAQKNAKDGISMVQTAEGALTEVHDMLNRMVTLAEQSANGTYANELDREQLQKEVVQLRDEINRIADSANFNGIKLLDGSMDSKNKVEATSNATLTSTLVNMAGIGTANIAKTALEELKESAASQAVTDYLAGNLTDADALTAATKASAAYANGSLTRGDAAKAAGDAAKAAYKTYAKEMIAANAISDANAKTAAINAAKDKASEAGLSAGLIEKGGIADTDFTDALTSAQIETSAKDVGAAAAGAYAASTYAANNVNVSDAVSVLGSHTILHETAPTPGKAGFYVDLNNYTVTDAGKIEINIGNVSTAQISLNVTAKDIGTDGELAPEELVNMIADDIADSASGTITIGNDTYNVYASGDRLRFESVNNVPATVAMRVKVSQSVTDYNVAAVASAGGSDSNSAKVSFNWANDAAYADGADDDVRLAADKLRAGFIDALASADNKEAGASASIKFDISVKQALGNAAWQGSLSDITAHTEVVGSGVASGGITTTYDSSNDEYKIAITPNSTGNAITIDATEAITFTVSIDNKGDNPETLKLSFQLGSLKDADGVAFSDVSVTAGGDATSYTLKVEDTIKAALADFGSKYAAGGSAHLTITGTGKNAAGTGTITVNSSGLTLEQSHTFASNDVITITVQASDGGTPASTATLTLSFTLGELTGKTGNSIAGDGTPTALDELAIDINDKIDKAFKPYKTVAKEDYDVTGDQVTFTVPTAPAGYVFKAVIATEGGTDFELSAVELEAGGTYIAKSVASAIGQIKLTGDDNDKIKLEVWALDGAEAIGTFTIDLADANKLKVASGFENGGTTKKLYDADSTSLFATDEKTSSTSIKFSYKPDIPYGGDYNTSTESIKPGANSGGGRLASTVLQADVAATTASKNIFLGKIKDGAAMTIGETTYMFKVGGDSTLTEDEDDSTVLVDLHDVANATGGLTGSDLRVALERLTVAAKDNAMFGVGYRASKGEITLTENKEYYQGGADGQVLLNTKAAIAGQISFGTVEQTESIETTASFAAADLTLQIGDTSDSFNQLRVSMKDMHTAAMGIGTIDISTQEGAQIAVDKIKDAINYVSDMRGTLGATQNRLEHTINNLSVMQENTQDAESTIRDTDVAEEMMAFTKWSILSQAAQAMLAQANQLPQGVLQLLG